MLKKYLICLVIAFISINAFGQPKNSTYLKLSDDFISNVPFERKNSLIYLTKVSTGQLNTSNKFLLDNGCSETFISESLARELNFNPSRKHSIIDIYSKKEKISFGRIDFIVGGVLFKNIKTGIISDESFEYECDVNGIIGLNLIEKCAWSISLKNGISISSDVSSFPVDDYAKQKMYHKNLIKCGIKNIDTLLVFLDLGMNVFFELNPEFIETPIDNMEIRNAVSSQDCEGGLFSYKNDSHPVKVKTSMLKTEGFALFGDSIVSGVIIDIDYSDHSYFAIGNDILSCYDILLNIKKKEFYSKNILTNLKYSQNFGFGYDVLDSMLIVNYIIENASAEKGGIQLNDTITQINNQLIFEIIDNVRNCELTKVVWDELYKNDEALIKISRLEKPILIQKEYLFKD